MLSIFTRSRIVRFNSSATLRLLTRAESIVIEQGSVNRQRQAFIRGGLAIVAIGSTGYLLNKTLNNPTIVETNAQQKFKQVSLIDAFKLNQTFSTSVKEHLRSTYAHFTGGLAMTGTFAYAFHRAGWSTHIMKMNKWMYLGISLLGTLGTLHLTLTINEQKHPTFKYAAWTLFNGTMGLSLAPLYFMQPAIMTRAAVMAAGIVGSISAIGMTARRQEYLWLGAPLMAGLTVVCLASLSSLAIPITAIRTLTMVDNISLYVSLIVFSGLVLYDTQKMIEHAENAEYANQLSPINDSLAIYLDAINIYIGLLINDGSRRK
ncbi:unnamed protein product [Rotaria sp. Silwood1]|nr:unnamed protein product [Rotaria sp. Silwood1]CAF4670709.1 unnamed protein product [Rotaria sp. Silwood1]CAF4940361.1 unnamed protein product [Rotaria sp. Silwood1]